MSMLRTSISPVVCAGLLFIMLKRIWALFIRPRQLPSAGPRRPCGAPPSPVCSPHMEAAVKQIFVVYASLGEDNASLPQWCLVRQMLGHRCLVKHHWGLMLGDLVKLRCTRCLAAHLFEEMIAIMRNNIIYELRHWTPLQSVYSKRHFIPERVPASIFRATHSDPSFVKFVCSSLDYDFDLQSCYLQHIPISGVSFASIMDVLFSTPCYKKYGSNYRVFSAKKDQIERLETLSAIMKREDMCALFGDEELYILEMVMEEILCYFGVYTCSIPIEEFPSVLQFYVSAERIFEAIPCQLLKGRHIVLADNYEVWVPHEKITTSPEWRCIIRKVHKVMSRKNPNQSCLHQGYTEQWHRYMEIPKWQRQMDDNMFRKLYY